MKKKAAQIPDLKGELEGSVSLASLNFYPDNPRRGDEESLERSLRANGWWGVLVVRREGRVILAGNHRARVFGRICAEDSVLDPQLPVYWVTCTDAQAAAIVLADNRVNDVANNDPFDLYRMLAGLDKEAALNVGYTPADVASIRALVMPPSVDELASLYGEHKERDASAFWPQVAFQLPPDLFANWQTWWDSLPGDDAVSRAQEVLARWPA